MRLWVVGQAAALRSATDLLLARAKSSDGAWPEFASYSCYSCHQTVGAAELRGVASAGPRPAGAPGWEVWSNTAIELAAEYCGAAYPDLHAPDLSQVKALRTMMEAGRTPPAAKVVEQANKALAQLDAWLVAMQAADDNRAALKPVPKGTAERLAHALAANALAKDNKLKDHDWDALAANYLGAAAMYHAAGGKDAVKTWGEPLLIVRDSLRFPPAKDGLFNSPADLDRKKLDQIRDNFELLRTKTGTPEGK